MGEIGDRMLSVEAYSSGGRLLTLIGKQMKEGERTVLDSYMIPFSTSSVCPSVPVLYIGKARAMAPEGGRAAAGEGVGEGGGVGVGEGGGGGGEGARVVASERQLPRTHTEGQRGVGVGGRAHAEVGGGRAVGHARPRVA